MYLLIISFILLEYMAIKTFKRKSLSHERNVLTQAKKELVQVII